MSIGWVNFSLSPKSELHFSSWVRQWIFHLSPFPLCSTDISCLHWFSWPHHPPPTLRPPPDPGPPGHSARSLPPPPLDSHRRAEFPQLVWGQTISCASDTNTTGQVDGHPLAFLFFFSNRFPVCVCVFVFVSWYDRDRIVALLQPPGDPNWSKPTTPLKADPRNWILCNRNHFCLSGGSNNLKCCALQKKKYLVWLF
jgi:hypothetical protein